MNRRIILFLIVLLMFTYSANIYAQNNDLVNDKLNNSIFYSPDYNSIDINDYIIRLPEDDTVLQDFGSEYQNQLKEMADRYGDTQNNLLDVVFTEEEINSNKNESNGQLVLNTNVNSDYNKLNYNDAFVNLNYEVDEKTSVRAGYEFININNYDSNRVINPDSNEFIEGNDIILSDQNSLNSRLGISYQTTDRVRIFADYVYNDILEQHGEATVFGLQYNNTGSQISAEYSIINELNEQGSSTGINYQYQDLANFSASYSSYRLLNSDDIINNLEKEKSWDFGVDFNLNEDSSFSIGFQVINAEVIEGNNNNGDSSELADEDEETKESSDNDSNSDNEESTSVEASFKIKF